MGHITDYTAMIKNHTSACTRNHSAFTLVEVLVIIAIVVLLVVVLRPTGGGAGPAAIEITYLGEIGRSVLAYADDNKGRIPTHPRYLAVYFDESFSQRDLFGSPYQDDDAALTRGKPSGAAFRYGGYVFLGLGTSLEEIDTPEKRILVYAARVSPEQTARSVLYADGHTKWLEEEKLRAALPDEVDVDALDGP